jgi:hypothetical protein
MYLQLHAPLIFLIYFKFWYIKLWMKLRIHGICNEMEQPVEFRLLFYFRLAFLKYDYLHLATGRQPFWTLGYPCGFSLTNWQHNGPISLLSCRFKRRNRTCIMLTDVRGVVNLVTFLLYHDCIRRVRQPCNKSDNVIKLVTSC